MIATPSKGLRGVKKERKGEQLMAKDAIVKLSFFWFIIVFRIFPGMILILLACTALFLNRQLLF
jgi:hypothetical protein